MPIKMLKVAGAKIPSLGLGTWDLRGAQCQRSVTRALELGYRHIDTAAAYDNEASIGAAIAASGVNRGDLFLVSKVYRTTMSAEGVRTSAEASLKALRTDYLDLLLIHWPIPEVPLAETLRALLKLKASGKARHIGVSNFTVKLLKLSMEIAGNTLVANQVEYHPFLSQGAVHEFLRAHGMVLTAYSPLARGMIFQSPVISAVAAKHGRSPAQVTLRWLLDQHQVAAIPKASSDGHLIDNLGVFEFSLNDDDRHRINDLRGSRRIADYPWSPEWDPT
ncbi:MAG: aldo/keto reductase [Burkholderiales bacterium]